MHYQRIPCNTMQYHAIPCNTMQYHAIPCSNMQYPASPWNTMQIHAIPCNTKQCHAIPCNTMQYHAIPCNTMQYHACLLSADGAYHCPVGSIWLFFQYKYRILNEFTLSVNEITEKVRKLLITYTSVELFSENITLPGKKFRDRNSRDKYQLCLCLM